MASTMLLLGSCGRKGDLELPKEERKPARQAPQQLRSADTKIRQARDLDPPPDA